jgi:hypothetical protein
VADKRHTNYKSHLQEYVQSTYRTHPVYRIRSEVGPDHSKQFMVEVIVGRRTLGEGKGRNKKEAEQAAARDALERVESGPASDRSLKAESRRDPRAPQGTPAPASRPVREAQPAMGTRLLPEPEIGTHLLPEPDTDEEGETPRRRRRGRRGGRGRRRPDGSELPVSRTSEGAPERTPEENGSGESHTPAPEAQRLRPRTPPVPSRPIVSRAEALEESRPVELEPLPPAHEEDDFEEVGRPEGPSDERFSWPATPAPRFEPEEEEERTPVFEPAEEAPLWEPEPVAEERVVEAEPQRPAPAVPRDPMSERAVTPSSAPAATPPATPSTPAFGRRPGRAKR